MLHRLRVQSEVMTCRKGLRPECLGASCPLRTWMTRWLAWRRGHFCFLVMSVWLSVQELRSREEELTRAALQQKSQEELLKRREQQLAEREIDVLERELNILIFQLNQEKPNVKKRKGKFKRSRLKVKDGHRISLPSGMSLFSCFIKSFACHPINQVVSSELRDWRMRF